MPDKIGQGQICVALSGGLDSIALTHLLHRSGLLGATLTIDHGLQASSRQWADQCEQYSNRLGARHFRAQVNCDQHDALRQRGLEEAARLARYQALSELAFQANCTVIAMAHHADDQAETFLLQALRGSGLAGLAGMPVWRQLQPGLWLWRPLLACPKSALEAYVARHALASVEDPSNMDGQFRRNAIRHQLLPVLEKIAPGFRRTLGRVSANIAEASQLLAQLGCDDFAACAVGEAGIALASLEGLASARQGLVLRHWCTALGLRAPSRAKLADMLKKIGALSKRNPPYGAVVMDYLDCEWLVERGGILRAQRQSERTAAAVAGERLAEMPINLASLLTALRVDCEALHGELELRRWSRESLVPKALCLSGKKLRAAAATNVRAQLRVRGTGQGRERLQVQQNRPQRTLKNLFQEARIPVSERMATPLLYLDQQLVAVPSIGVNVDWQAATGASDGDAYQLIWHPRPRQCRD